MTSHVGFQSVSAGVSHALSGAADPFTGVFLLPVLNVVVVNVFYQSIHVAKVTGVTTIPGAMCDLLLELFLVELSIDGGIGNIA